MRMFRGEKYSSVILCIKKTDNATAWSQWIPIGQAIPVYKQLNWTTLLRTRVIALEYYPMEYFEWNTQKQWVN